MLNMTRPAYTPQQARDVRKTIKSRNIRLTTRTHARTSFRWELGFIADSRFGIYDVFPMFGCRERIRLQCFRIARPDAVFPNNDFASQ